MAVDEVDAAVLSVDDLVDRLDARCAETGERWDLYRAAVGGWIANARDRHESGSSDPAALSVRASTISEALAGLLATPRVPVVPHQPRPCAGVMTVVKDGSKWKVCEDGQFLYRAETKRRGLEIADAHACRVRELYEAWLAEWWTLVESGTEGVDFYWKGYMSR